MADFGDLGGAFAYLESFFLWQIIGQVASTMLSPAFNALQQDALKTHPNMVLTPDLLARAVVQTFIDRSHAEAEAARSGIDSTRFGTLVKLAEVRLTPVDLATAVLRSYETREAAAAQARLQGVTGDRFDTMTLLAGDAIGPQQAAEAVRRKIIPRTGHGPDSTSFDQAIAESRLHNKWADVLFKLSQYLLSPPDLASAVERSFVSFENAAAIAALSGVNAEQFGLAQLHQVRGRIGRGAQDAFGILVAAARRPEACQRLRVLEETNDGFRIAEVDLQLRGPGELLGHEQSGLPKFRFGDLTQDLDLIQQARDLAARLLKTSTR